LNEQPRLLRSKMFWVGVLYFAQGFPLGVFYDVLPVHFRQLGVDLRTLGVLSLLGLAWTLKFLWAPAIDHFRHHRRWMFAVDLAMGGCLLWLAIGLFTLLSATNDIAIDGYTIEQLEQRELGRANGIRIALYRVGMLTAGAVLILSDVLGWAGAYGAAALLLAVLAVVCLNAPPETAPAGRRELRLAAELRALGRRPRAVGAVLLLLLATLWLIDDVTHWSRASAYFWWIALLTAGAILAAAWLHAAPGAAAARDGELARGPMFGALMEMLARPGILPILGFVLIFKLGDAAMGFMVKPFWVDSGFSATQIGLVSVNIGLVLSIAGGVVGGWYTDRVGIFKALWVLGLAQAISNLGYVWAALAIPSTGTSLSPAAGHQAILYSASALESFTGGLGTAAFLAFLMAITHKTHAATEYAILSSLFALTRHLAGFASGYGAHYLGYAPYFLLTFFLSFPAYLLLPWIRRTLRTAPVSNS
jgi:PAT family beta-lactamase induction signal transducer AmpG